MSVAGAFVVVVRGGGHVRRAEAALRPHGLCFLYNMTVTRGIGPKPLGKLQEHSPATTTTTVAFNAMLDVIPLCVCYYLLLLVDEMLRSRQMYLLLCTRWVPKRYR